jgi:tetratricopeptide (TPR) repeat protein
MRDFSTKFLYEFMTHLYRILFSFGIVVALTVLPMMAKAQAATVAIAPMDATEFFKLGVEETRSEKYEQAIADFTQAIELDADFAAAYSNRCLVYLQLGDYTKAADDCTTSLQLNPDNTEAYLNRGLAYYRLGNYQSAISEYAQVIEHDSNDFRAYYNRGLARFELKDYERAIADYNQALRENHQRSNPLLADVYNDRGLAQLMLENVPDAIADFSLAISIDGSNQRAFYNRACACHRNNDYTGAIRDFTLALQIDPNHAEAYVNRGLIHHELGLQQAALSDLKTASKHFDERGNKRAYQHTLALIERLQQLLLSSDESVVSQAIDIAVFA